MSFFERAGEIFGFRRFSEEDNHIKAVYVALAKAEKELKVWNEVTYITDIRSKREKDKENLPIIAKNMKEERLQHKAAILSQLKREINKVLREF